MHSRRLFLKTAALAGSALATAAGNQAAQAAPSEPTTLPTTRIEPELIPTDKKSIIELIAPSSYSANQEAVDRAISRLRQEGHTIRGEAVARRNMQGFAGTDAERAHDVNQLAHADHPLPDIALAVRGGYGSGRILSMLDYSGLKARLTDKPIALVGFSDFTAIQLALLAQTGLVTFAGPMLATNFGASPVSAFTINHFWQILSTPRTTLQFTHPQTLPESIKTVNVNGILWGGNLSLVVAMMDTPYFPQIDRGILFVEDVSERPFQIERMLYQLYLSGVLARQQALILGDFTHIPPGDDSYGLTDMIAHMRSILRIPIIVGLPFGHGRDLVTLPVGGNAQLKADSQGFTMRLSHYPHL